MTERKLVQYGWLTGPVECRCSNCDWGSVFDATDSSIPGELLAEFAAHRCREDQFEAAD